MDVVAVVGPVEIRTRDYCREVERRHAVRQAANDPRVLLRELVDRQVLVRRAYQFGLDRDPELQRSYENLLIGKLRAEKLEPLLKKVAVTPAEVRDYYDKHQEKFSISAKMRLAILRRRVRVRTRKKILKKMQVVRREALALPVGTLGFGALAIGNSEDQISRYRGGDAGWFVLGRSHPHWPAAVLEAGRALPRPGAISAVIETPKNLYLVRLIDRKSSSIRPLE
jgi:hypothetical protein